MCARRLRPSVRTQRAGSAPRVSAGRVLRLVARLITSAAWRASSAASPMRFHRETERKTGPSTMCAASIHARSAAVRQREPGAACIGISTPKPTSRSARSRMRNRSGRSASIIHFLEFKRSDGCFALWTCARTTTNSCANVAHDGIVCGPRESGHTMTIDNRRERDVHRRAQSFVVEGREGRRDEER